MKKKMLVGLMSIMFVLSIVGFALAQATAPGVADKVKVMTAKVRAEVPKVSMADVKAVIDAKEKVVILDVRDKDEFDTGRLPGAINVSRGRLEFRIAAAVPDLNARIIAYCVGAVRSAFAVKTLMDLGYKNVAIMDAPLADWIKAGFPIER